MRDRNTIGKHTIAAEAKSAAAAWVPMGGAVEATSMLRPGGRVVGLTMGQFSLIDIIGAVLSMTGPAHVKLSTWTAGIRDAHNCGFMLDSGRMLSFSLFVDKSFPSREPAYCAAIARVFGDNAVNCADMHAKVCTVRNGAWNVTIRGSMNLNKNPRIEQFDIDDDESIAAFFDAHFDNLARVGVPLARGKVPSSVIDDVFDRVRRGVNPFAVESAAVLEAAGVKFGAEFRQWALDAMAENRKAKSGPCRRVDLAGLLNCSLAEIESAMTFGAGALCCDMASALIGSRRTAWHVE